MPVELQGQVQDFYLKPKFRVEIDGFKVAEFSKCSALEKEIEVAKYRAGGRLAEHKQAALVTFSDVTLERGACKDQDFYNWSNETADAATNTGLAEPKYKRVVDIVQLDPENKTMARWRLYEAFPVKFTAGDWDANASEVVIEMLTLTFHHFRRIKA